MWSICVLLKLKHDVHFEKKKNFHLCQINLLVLIRYVNEVNMYFTISQTSAFEMGHWMALSIFILTISSGELKADSLAGTEKLRDTGAVFGKGKIKN